MSSLVCDIRNHYKNLLFLMIQGIFSSSVNFEKIKNPFQTNWENFVEN